MVWTREQTDFLIENYMSMTNKQLAEKLNLNIGHISGKLNSLKLLRKEKKPHYEFLVNNINKMSNAQLAQYLGITEKRVDYFLTRYNLKRSSEYKIYCRDSVWNEESIQFLKDNYDKMTYVQIAKILNTTKFSVSSKATHLGLKKLKREECEVIEGEIWKQYKNSTYAISTFGRVKNIKDDLIIQQSFNRNYYSVHIIIHKKSIHLRIHRMVAETFIINEFDKETVNHIDGNTKNNNISNLEWSTIKENNNHALITGLNSGKALTINDVNEICILLEQGNSPDIIYNLGKFNCSVSTLADIKKRKTWKNISINYGF